ncbi:MAG: polymer-forming cytoskeletal protein [Chlamydiales bacterium]|nr:polymer-forming cytoskeletal protein [Chlamydiales bacterium]
MFKKPPRNFLDQDLIPSNQSDFSSLTSSFPSSLKTAHQSDTLASQEESAHEEPETTISANVSMRGTLAFHKVLRIDGIFEGELLSSGKIIIGPTGQVKANIDLDEAFISGKVEGNIRVRGRCVLRGRAEIRGDISAHSLSVDEGVIIAGHVRVGPVDSNPLLADIDLDNPLLH